MRTFIITTTAAAALITTTAASAAATVTRPAISGVIAVHPGLFVTVSGIRPNIRVRYLPWGAYPPASDSGRVLTEIRPPVTVTMSSIAAGRADPWLRALAARLRHQRSPMLSFAPEANAWGRAQMFSPAAYIAAYRHVTVLMGWRVASVWQVSHWQSRWTVPLARLWPGWRYVRYAAVDGYISKAGGDTGYAVTFHAAILAVRRLTRVPLFLGEAGVGTDLPGRLSLVRGLVAGARRDRLAGLIYFDRGMFTITDMATLRAYGAAMAGWRY